jgi:hypothetical protein
MQSAHDLGEAALTALQVPLRYLERGRNLAWAAMAGASRMTPGRHYPEHDVQDSAHHSRFYYHAHPIDGGQGEHGHFHVFHVREAAFYHLAALSLDPQGRPMRWFTTNRWVTGEVWPAPHDLGDLVRCFAVRTKGKMAPVAAWLQAMFALYRDDIVRLLEEREQRLSALTAQQRQALGEDRGTHVLDSSPIHLQQRVAQILEPMTGDDS